MYIIALQGHGDLFALASLRQCATTDQVSKRHHVEVGCHRLSFRGGTLINNLPAPHGQQSGLAALCYDPFYKATAHEETGHGLYAVCQCRILSCNCAARNWNCKPCSKGCVQDAPSSQYSNSWGRVAIDLPAKFFQSIDDSIVFRLPNEHL